jgi:predicted ferric reductase
MPASHTSRVDTSLQSDGRRYGTAYGVRERANRQRLTVAALWLVAGGNAAWIVWLWYHGGNVTAVHSTGEFLTSIARITGLLGAYSALLEVLLLARLPALERRVGFDRLTVWHRWNGHACLYLILGHVVFSVVGYAEMDRYTIRKEISTMIWGGVYPGMITATIGTALFILAVVSSIVIVKRRLRYESWYFVHLSVYAAIALGWFHQIPTGNELVLDRAAADYWNGLYLATLVLLLVFRFGEPALNAFRYRLRVVEVLAEAPGVVSLRIAGRNLDRLNARAGQFFLWRFLSPNNWWKSHPFSLSEAPDGRSFRITVKSLGDFTSRIGEIAPGTRVVAEGPFGVFTDRLRRRAKMVLIAGGIGITPIRALIEESRGELVVIYRVLAESDVVFRAELESLAAQRGFALHIVVGDHRTDEGRNHLSPDHLRELVPDIAECEVYVCGPPAMANALAANVAGTDVPARFVHVERFAL